MEKWLHKMPIFFCCWLDSRIFSQVLRITSSARERDREVEGSLTSDSKAWDI
jgi:hypothetical protein